MITTGQDESALVVMVPEAEFLVRGLRSQFDTSAQAGLGAHVTILFPFLAPEHLRPDVITALADLFASQARFAFALSGVERFPSILYLAPNPAAGFAQLTTLVAAAFPECPPYGGAFATPVPHLTVAAKPPAEDLESVDIKFRQEAVRVLPIQGVVREVTLVTKRSGRWSPTSGFPLA